MAPLISAEFLLVAACATWPPSNDRTEAIGAAATRSLDWLRVLRVAKRHRVLGLVHDGLMRARPGVPSEVAREIGSQAMALVRENLEMAGKAVQLQRMFDDAGLTVLFLKGASLASLAYGNLGLRGGKDIDILVSPEKLPRVTVLLEDAGYRRFEPPPDISQAQLRLLMPLRKDLGFIHERTGLQIELHWRLFLNPHAMDESSVMTASRGVPMVGTMGLRTLGEEDLFTYLCMHGALHWWNQLKWLADIGALLASSPEGGAERLNRAAQARGAGWAAAQAMRLCGRILHTPLPASLTRGQTAKMRWLEETALKAMIAGGGELEPRDMRFGTTRGSLSAFLLGQSWHYRLAELRNLLTSETDVLTVPLPERLGFLYPMLRLPLWVWRHASRPVAGR